MRFQPTSQWQGLHREKQGVRPHWIASEMPLKAMDLRFCAKMPHQQQWTGVAATGNLWF
jgi:hypothetical protein